MSVTLAIIISIPAAGPNSRSFTVVCTTGTARAVPRTNGRGPSATFAAVLALALFQP